MIYWYRAACFEHKETIQLFVDCPTATAAYLREQDQEIKDWLLKHHYCRLELVTEADPDRVWNAGCFDPIMKMPRSADPSLVRSQPGGTAP